MAASARLGSTPPTRNIMVGNSPSPCPSPTSNGTPARSAHPAQKTVALHQQHIGAVFGGRGRSGKARRTTSDHDDVEGPEHFRFSARATSSRLIQAHLPDFSSFLLSVVTQSQFAKN